MGNCVRNTCEACAYYDPITSESGRGWCLVSPPVFRGAPNYFDITSWCDPIVLRNRLCCRYFKRRVEQENSTNWQKAESIQFNYKGIRFEMTNKEKLQIASEEELAEILVRLTEYIETGGETYWSSPYDCGLPRSCL